MSANGKQQLTKKYINFVERLRNAMEGYVFCISTTAYLSETYASPRPNEIERQTFRRSLRTLIGKSWQGGSFRNNNVEYYKTMK